MARRKGVRYRTRNVYKKAKRRYNRRGGSLKPLINGAMAGAGAEIAQKFLGNYGAPVAFGAVGMWKNDSTLKTLAGIQAGSIIADMMPVIGGGGSAVSGGLLFGD